MFIKKVSKTNGRSKKKYTCLHLVESIRTPKGPRQRLILNLGNLDIDPSQYVTLARRIEEIFTGQRTVLEIDPTLESLARSISKKLFEKKASEENNNQADFQMVDTSSIEVSHPRSIGAEYVCHSFWQELGISSFLKTHYSQNEIALIESLVVARLVEPKSELHTKSWIENRSGFRELCRMTGHASINSYYRASDNLLKVKDNLETFLGSREKELFKLAEKIFLYDLTNTYFEGLCKRNPKAAYGRSKEKRSDCKLQTLGMIVDELGFCKHTEFFKGNQSEPATLSGMLDALKNRLSHTGDATVVIDAGIATAENIELLKAGGFHYISVYRGKPKISVDFENMTLVKEDATKGIRIEVKKYEDLGEAYIVCRSLLKQQKERSMRSRVEKLLLERLEYIKAGLKKNGSVKAYESVLKRIGRLMEKYPKAAKLYEIEVMSDDGGKKAIDIVWKEKAVRHSDEVKAEGMYILRTDRTDLDEKEIFSLYRLLENIEKAFLAMKSHIGFRPNFHQKTVRVEGHMFISVVAYHILNAIEHRLKRCGDTRKWSTVRDILSTHERVTLHYRIKNQDGNIRTVLKRLCTALEPEHVEIYNTLGLSLVPLGTKVFGSESVVTTKKRNSFSQKEFD